MDISQTIDRRLSRSALFGHLSAQGDDSWTERTVYVTSESLQGKSSTPVLSGPVIEAIIKHVGISATGLVLFRREEEVEVIEPPGRNPLKRDGVLDPPLAQDRDSCWIYTLSDDERSNRMLPLDSGDLWVVSRASELVLASFRVLGMVMFILPAIPNATFVKAYR